MSLVSGDIWNIDTGAGIPPPGPRFMTALLFPSKVIIQAAVVDKVTASPDGY